MKKIFTILLLFMSFILIGCEDEVKNTYKLSDDNIVITIGESYKINLYENDEIVTSSITWLSSSSSVASVNNGLITGVGVGECAITVVYNDEALLCNVVVNKPLTYGLNETNLTLDLNDTFELFVTNGVDTIESGVIWVTTNPMYASVDNGLVTAKGVGSVTINAIYNGETYACNIEIVNVFKIILNTSLDDTTYTVNSNSVTYKTKKMSNNETLTLDYSINKENSSDSDVVYFESSDENVATINESGVITAVNSGVTVITLTSAHLSNNNNYILDFILLVDNESTNNFFDEDVKEYNSLYSWQGFDSKILGAGNSNNTNWIKSNLITIDATINLTLNKNNTFTELSNNLPLLGYNHNFDYNQNESTVNLAEEKYGNAYFEANSNTYEGVILNYSNSLYLITCDNNGNLNTKVRTLSLDSFNYKPIAINNTTNDLEVDITNTTGISGNYEEEISNEFNKIRLDLFENSTYKYFTLDNDNNQYVIASGVYKINNNKLYLYYNNNIIELDYENNILSGLNIDCGFSFNDIELNLINIIGVYESNLYVSEMDTNFKFDITFNSDNTYTYYRYETEVNGSNVTSGVVNSGTYSIENGILNLSYVENGNNLTMEFNILSSNYISSINELPTGYMTTNLTFIKE